MGLNRVSDGDSIMIAIPEDGCESGGRWNGTNRVPGKVIQMGGDVIGIPNDSFEADTTGNVTLHLAGVFSNMSLTPGDEPEIGDKLWHDELLPGFLSSSENAVFAGHAMSEAVDIGGGAYTVSVRLKG